MTPLPGRSGAVHAFPRRRALALVTGGLVAAAGVAGGRLILGHETGGSTDGGLSGPERPTLGVLDSARPEVGKPAPDFALRDARDGTTVRRLSSYRGKTVALNWFASWCGPCQAEIPDFQVAYESLAGEVVVLGVNLQEPRDRASGMIEKLSATFPAVLDSDGEVARHYRLLGMPSTFFIDRDGTLRSFVSGRITANALRGELAKLGHRY